MRYAVYSETDIGRVVHSLHREMHCAVNAAYKKQGTMAMPFRLKVGKLRNKGEVPGWERGDVPSKIYWPDLDE